MKKFLLGFLIFAIVIGIALYFKKAFAPAQTRQSNQNSLMTQDMQITPINHATVLLSLAGKIIYTDPVDPKLFDGKLSADIILVTDIHGDHFNTSSLEALVKDTTSLVVPKAVADLLPENLKVKAIVMTNGENKIIEDIKIEAVPMYNIPESDKAFHTKGRGNGYVVEAAGKRIYFSGDTSATPEMKALKNIDVAFVCMNLPYTIDVEEAVQGVLAFKPKEVIPYHYRGQNGLSDINKFKELVNKGDANIKVELMDFYK